MTNKEHITLLVTLNSTLRGIYEGQVTGGGDLWDASPKAKRIQEAIRDLESREPTTFGAIDAVGQVAERMKARGPSHFKRFDDRAAILVGRGHGVHEAMGISMAFEDVLGGFEKPDWLGTMPDPIQKGYNEGRKQAVEALK